MARKLEDKPPDRGDPARQVLLAYAVDRHRKGEASFSELAQETGLAVEEIMEAMALPAHEAREMFLTNCRTVAKLHDDPEFLRMGEQTAKALWGDVA